MYHNVEKLSRKKYAKIKNIGGIICEKTTISKSWIIVDFCYFKAPEWLGTGSSNVDNTKSIMPILINV